MRTSKDVVGGSVYNRGEGTLVLPRRGDEPRVHYYSRYWSLPTRYLRTFENPTSQGPLDLFLSRPQLRSLPKGE